VRLRIASIAFLLGAISVGICWFTLQVPLATLLDALKKSGSIEALGLARHVQTLLPVYLALDLVVVTLFSYAVIQLAVGRPLSAAEESIDRLGQLQLSVPLAKGGPLLSRLQKALARMAEALQSEQQRNRQQLDELTLANQQLTRAQTELVASDRLATVGKLAAGVAHEVGNPLSGILGYLSLLTARAQSPEEVKDLSERIEAEVKRIDQIVRSLLELGRPSRREAGPQDLGTLVQSAVSLLRAGAEFKGVEIKTEVPTGLYVRIEPGPIAQVLVNLLLNAAQAMGGKGALSVSAKHAGAEVLLEVADQGPGLTPEVQARLFEPFFTTKPAGQGTGLGLAVSKHLLSTQGGGLEAKNGPNGGAVFVMRLPAA
jgi:two-component system, NtrC family, sensor kinase